MKFILLPFFLFNFSCAEEPSLDHAPDGEDDIFLRENGGKSDAPGIQEGSYKAICVLSFVNQSTKDEIFEVAHSIPAAKIWKKRAGPDEVLGTEDDFLFNSVAELDEVSFVGFFTFRALANYAMIFVRV